MQINEQLKKRSKKRGFYLLRRQTLLVFYFLFLNYSYWMAEKKLKNKKNEKSFVGLGSKYYWLSEGLSNQ